MGSRTVVVGLHAIAALSGLFGAAVLIAAGYELVALLAAPRFLFQAESGIWIVLFAGAELLLGALGFGVMYGLLTLRRWAWAIVVATSGFLLGLFSLSVVLAVSRRDVLLAQGYRITFWYAVIIASPACVLGFCLTPSVRRAMVR